MHAEEGDTRRGKAFAEPVDQGFEIGALERRLLQP
jgi:hypothetical protein